MEEKSTHIITVQVNNSEAIKAMAEYQAKIDATKQAEQALRAEIKKQGRATSEQRQEIVKLKEQQKSYAAEIRTLSKEVQNNIIAEQKYKNTLKGLGAELSNAKDKLRAMTLGTKEYAEQERIVSVMNDRIKEAEASYGVFSRNVGNYPDLQPLNTQLETITKTLAQMRYEGKDTSAEFQKLMAEASKMKDAIDDTQKQIVAGASDVAVLQSLGQAAQTLAGAWNVWNSVVGLSIKEDSRLADAMKNLQIGITAITSLTTIMTNVQKQSALMQGVVAVQTKAQAAALKLETAAISKNIVIQKAATAAQAAFNAVANMNPYILLASGLAAIGVALIAFTSDTKKSREQLAAFNDETARTNEMLKKQSDLQDFNIKAMQAAGASEEDVLQQRRANAQANLNTQKEALEKLEAMYNAANKKTRKKMQETLDAQREIYKEYQHEVAGIDEEIALHAIKRNKEAEDEQTRTTKEATEKRIALRKAALDIEQKETMAAEDARIALMAAGVDKELEQERIRHERALDQLRNRLETDNNLTMEARKAINEQIEYEIQSHEQKVTAIQAAASKSRNDALASTIDSITSMLDKTTDEQIADVHKMYAGVYKEIERLREENAAPDRAGFATEEEYAEAMAQYEDFLANIADTELRLQMQQAEAVMKLRMEETKKTNDEILKQEADRLANAAAERKAAYDEELAAAGHNEREKYEAKMRYLQGELEAEGVTTEERKKIIADMKKTEEEYHKARTDMVLGYAEKVSETLGQINEAFNAMDERQLQKAQDRYDKERDALDDNLAAGLISQEDYNAEVARMDEELDAQKAEISRKQAAREKLLAIFEIGINTAKAIVESLPNLVLAALAGVMGAAQLATVVATPLPKAARGMYIRGKRHSQGGQIIEAEDGEVVMNRNSVAMFGPALSAMNVAGGGVPFALRNDGGYSVRRSAATPAAMEQAVDVTSIIEATAANTRAAMSEVLAGVKIYTTVEDIRQGEKQYAQIESRGKL